MPARRQSAVSGDGLSTVDGKARGKDGKEKETFGCPYPGCGQSYSRMEYLKRHQRKHQDVRPFQCKDCSKSFARSDVLLRHRRRCHPTPPPPDRSSTSPPPVHRGYHGVPISSSRTDAREASPSSYRGRKHPRASNDNGDGQQRPSSTRRRLEDEPEEGEDERYAESSRYGRHNGMGNGGVYGMNNYYSGTDDSSTYTPHLLPMFQQNVHNQHDQHDSNHLEDASVLLSMAYGGTSSNETEPTVQGQRVVADDWSAPQTIHMMMDASSTGNPTGVEDQSKGDGTTATAVNEINTPPLPESMANFLGAMNWLGMASKDGAVTGEGANTWNNSNGSTTALSSPRPTSLFPMSSLFSPSILGIPTFNFNSNNSYDAENGEVQDMNQAAMSMLDQLAMYDVPQTKFNPNPERPLLRVEAEHLLGRAGAEITRDSRFFLPANRFAGCYQIPQWSLPPLRTLSLMAHQMYDSILNHFPFIHTPTFKLVDTAVCLAFAICTVGGVRTDQYNTDHLLGRGGVFPPSDRSQTADETLDGPLPRGHGWESMRRNIASRDDVNKIDIKHIDMWENGHIVRDDKSNMLVKSFSLAKGVLMTEYNVALLQSLIVYNAPYFLSEEENQRTMANMSLGTIVNIARQIGFFAPELEHFEPDISVPAEPYTPSELDLYWRRWIQLETRRRTAYLVYLLDTVSAIESNIPCILTSTELSLIPLPTPDSIWKAETSEQWFKAVKIYRPMTLDEAMRRVFFLPTYGAFDALHERADTKFYNLLNESEYGPFARVTMVITLLRGIMDIGEGKRDRGDWRDLTDLWISCSWLRPGKKMLDCQGNDLGEVTKEGLRQRFSMGLERWRQGWDFDKSCPNPAQDYGRSSTTSPLGESASPSSISSGETEKKALRYCEEALPYYWLSQALLNILNSAPPNEPGWKPFTPGQTYGTPGVRYGEMLKSARLFTRRGEGLGFAAASAASTGSSSSVNVTTSQTGDGLSRDGSGGGDNGALLQGEFSDFLAFPGVDILAN